MKKVLTTLLLLTVLAVKAQFTDLHDFSTAEGFSSLTYVSGKLYGTVATGGNGVGYVYSLNTDGTGFTILHNFSNVDNTSPINPCGSLLHYNGVLYGMTTYGGDSTTYSSGTIYKLNIDGSGFAVLHYFTQPLIATDGAAPFGSLIISDNILYGMTGYGGAVYTQSGGKGTIFKMNIDGTNFSLLHSFAQGEDRPYGSLLLNGDFLFGLTSAYSSGGNGHIFKINKDGTGYSILHSFGGVDGGKPNGSLVISGNTLYGMTPFGGNLFTGVRKGNVFKINTDGSGFQSIYNDLNGSTYYTWSYGSLVLVGNVLYGKSNVNLYSLNTDGTGYQWYNWSLYGSTTGSFDPMENGNLTYGGGALYGVNNRFGGASGNGVIYKFTPTNLGESDLVRENKIVIYPNPTNDQITIDFGTVENASDFTLKISNVLGQTIFSEISDQQQTISLNSFGAKGIYFVKLYNASGSLIDTQKVILK